jgi:hypothetical protein
VKLGFRVIESPEALIVQLLAPPPAQVRVTVPERVAVPIVQSENVRVMVFDEQLPKVELTAHRAAWASWPKAISFQVGWNSH